MGAHMAKLTELLHGKHALPVPDVTALGRDVIPIGTKMHLRKPLTVKRSNVIDANSLIWPRPSYGNERRAQRDQSCGWPPEPSAGAELHLISERS
jgi:hypothetical protein